MSELPAERVHAMPPCSPARFTTMLGSCDLLLSLNVGASTLGRAVQSDIPAVVLTNGFAVPGPENIDEVEAKLGALTPAVRDWLTGMLPLHRMRMWPLGFYDFLEPILAANPYTQAFLDIEMLDEAAVTGGIERALYDTATREQMTAARGRYLATLDSQVNTLQTFADVADHVGLTL
jgi:hypothetical protein